MLFRPFQGVSIHNNRHCLTNSPFNDPSEVKTIPGRSNNIWPSEARIHGPAKLSIGPETYPLGMHFFPYGYYISPSRCLSNSSLPALGAHLWRRACSHFASGGQDFRRRKCRTSRVARARSRASAAQEFWRRVYKISSVGNTKVQALRVMVSGVTRHA